MKGTFTNTSYGFTTTITFGEQYNPPKVVTLSQSLPSGAKDERTVHGTYTIIYYSGTTFTKYYYVSTDASDLVSSFDLTGDRYHLDFQILNTTQFKLKESGSYLWDTYTKI